MPKYFIKESQLFGPQHLLIAGGIKKYIMAGGFGGEGHKTILEACKKSSSSISLGKYCITSEIPGTCASVWSGNFISFPISATSFPLHWKHFKSPNNQYNCKGMKQKGLPIRGAACLFSQALFSFTFMAVLIQQISHVLGRACCGALLGVTGSQQLATGSATTLFISRHKDRKSQPQQTDC